MKGTKIFIKKNISLLVYFLTKVKMDKKSTEEY